MRCASDRRIRCQCRDDERRLKLPSLALERSARRTLRACGAEECRLTTQRRWTRWRIAAALALTCGTAVCQSDTNTIPENARSAFHGWECNRGFAQKDAACVPLEVPANAYLNSQGSGWYCNRGYRRDRQSCVAVTVPPNAYADEADFTNGWQCNRGYRRAGKTCAAVVVPANAYLADSTYQEAIGVVRRVSASKMRYARQNKVVTNRAAGRRRLRRSEAADCRARSPTPSATITAYRRQRMLDHELIRWPIPSRMGGQPCMMRINAATSIVAKFEKVSDTAYGKMIRSLCRMPPHVYTTFGT